MPVESELEPGKSWVFDEGVADAFDDMIARSIPEHDEMRRSVAEVAARFAFAGSSVVDLGCSRGGALATVRSLVARRVDVEYVGAEISKPMLAAARSRFAGVDGVSIQECDLRTALPDTTFSWSVALSILTIQFTPIEYRQRIVRRIWERIAPGGVFIFVEKVLGATATINDALVGVHYDRKRANGYSDDEIERKRLSLEGVLVPVTARWNEELLRSAGFDEVDCFWRSLNFAGWLAIRA